MTHPREVKENHHPSVPDLLREAAETWTPDVGINWPLPRASWSDDVQQSYEAYKRDVSAKVAREVDVATVMRYFDVLEMQARVFEELIELNSMITETSQGNMASHPHLATFARLITVGIKLANEIGATPVSRIKLGLYTVEGQAATVALHQKINQVSLEPVSVELDGDEVVLSW